MNAIRIFVAATSILVLGCGGKVVGSEGSPANSIGGMSGVGGTESGSDSGGGTSSGTGGTGATGGASGGSGGSGEPEAGPEPQLEAGPVEAGPEPQPEAGPEASVGCPGTGGPTMVRLPQGYCIDSTEVTRDHYATWLATMPSTGGQDPWCWWNVDYTPLCEWPPGNLGSHPVACIDWCDAVAYCRSVGKHLCGRIGGGPNAFSDYADASRSQWYDACSSGGANTFPYGNTYDPTKCNEWNNAIENVLPVGSLPACSSPTPGYEGVYDLIGNVYEWEDSCDGVTGENDQCRLRGGASGHFSYGCDEELMKIYRNNKWAVGGFRCCFDP